MTPIHAQVHAAVTATLTDREIAFGAAFSPLEGNKARVKIKIVWIGKTKEPAITSLTDEYLKRISATRLWKGSHCATKRTAG
jgi:hypothetical protein